MKHAVFNHADVPIDKTPHDRVTTKLGHLLSLARIGVAASDTSLLIDLDEYGFGSLFEVMAEITNEIIDDVDSLQDRPEEKAQ